MKKELITIDTEGHALLNEMVSIQIAEFESVVKELKAKEDELKSKILQEMEARNLLKVESCDLSISYTAQHTKETFDNKKFREDYPDLYDEYVKFSSVKSSLRINLK